MKPRLIVVADPNGAGKTTITEKLLRHEWMKGCTYVNPDIIAQEKFGGWNSQEAILKAAKYAQRIAIRVMEGGHDVPITKIINRYYRSINYCVKAVSLANRSYFYNNPINNENPTQLFRTTDGEIVKFYQNLPPWAKSISEQFKVTK